MTTEEALKRMQAVKSYMTSGNPIWSVTEIGDAFDMAIEALGQPERKTGRWVVDTRGRIHCSNCIETPANRIIIDGDVVYNMEPIREIMKYCPRCGASMTEEKS